MNTNIYKCFCDEDCSKSQKELKTNKLIIEDPENPNIAFEIYVKDGQLFQSKKVTTVTETILYNTEDLQTNIPQT